jgi:hypothetical protein
MDFILYVYVPAITTIEVRLLLQVLKDTGSSITHLGKNDPPKKWSGTSEEAKDLILSGSDMTLWTFIRDAKCRLDATVEIHRDPRWKHSTISVSSPEAERLRHLCECLTTGIKAFAAILGQSDGEKDQPWKILYLSDDCPSELAAKFS